MRFGVGFPRWEPTDPGPGAVPTPGRPTKMPKSVALVAPSSIYWGFRGATWPYGRRIKFSYGVKMEKVAALFWNIFPKDENKPTLFEI